MSTTPTQLLARAVSRSSMNKSDLVDPTVVLAWAGAEQRKLYAKAAVWNPEFFGKVGTTATRSTYTAPWNWRATPGGVAAITKIRIATITGTVTGLAVGDDCGYVSKRYQAYNVTPRVYRQGAYLYGVGTELGAADANMVTALELDYAELPGPLTGMDVAIVLPDEWTTLIEIQLAKALALKDQRREDIQLLDEEYAMWFTTFKDHVLAIDHGAARPLDSIPALPAPPTRG